MTIQLHEFKIQSWGLRFIRLVFVKGSLSGVEIDRFIGIFIQRSSKMTELLGDPLLPKGVVL